MLTPEQLDNWFTYHAPTDETAPKYAAIRAAEAHAASCVTAILNGGELANYADINARCRAFAMVIDEMAPDSADKTAAIRCVRLARNAANEAVAEQANGDPGSFIVIGLCQDAERELRKARWQANSAIACGGK